VATARKRGGGKSRLARLREGLPLREWLVSGGWHRPLMALVLSVALAFLMADLQRAPNIKLSLDEFAERDVLAWTDFTVPNYQLTSEAQKKAEAATRPVFVYDEIVVEELLRRIDRSYTELREYLVEARTPLGGAEGTEAEGSDPDAPPPPEPVIDTIDFDHKLDVFESDLGVTLTEIDREILLGHGHDTFLRHMVLTLVERAMSRMIIADTSELPDDARAGISLVRVRGADRSEEALYDFEGLATQQQARQEVSLLAGELFESQRPVVRSCAVNVAGSMVRINVTFDASETRVRREQARLAVGTKYDAYQEGQVIIRKGERVTQDHMDAMEEMDRHRGGYKLWLNVVSLTLLLMLLVVASYTFAARFISKYATSKRDLAVQAVLALLAVSLCRVGEMVAAALSEAFPVIPEASYYYAIPVAATVVLVRILMNSETALVFASVVAVTCAYTLGGDLMLAAYFLVGSVAGAGALAHAKERGKIFRAGMIAALLNVMFVITLSLIHLSLFGPHFDDAETRPLFDILFALLCGFGVGIIALGLIPVFEAVGFLTDIKLLELASLDHPLLREMVIKAPGTYHHSVLVGSLSEAAAEAISANALLSRVGAYFHDIGKTVKTNYYVENQQGPSNVHDRLSPPMSALIIINHVKEGMELGRQHRLPEAILDIIPQHHGTALIRFFYDKALRAADEDKAKVNEDDYRYPGPKPQTREAGIVMLADGVEASTRALKEPTRHNISAQVQRVINSVVIDGQLDQCPLTLKDLSIVAETFTSVLVGIHHHRIEYPDDSRPRKDVSAKNGGPSKSGTERKGGGKGGGKGGTRALTLELPPMEANPDLPHPLDKVARAKAEKALRSSEPGTAPSGLTVDSIGGPSSAGDGGRRDPPDDKNP
jgi:cyclic-di-AMP phosphodiesterase PgpH